MQQSKTPKGKEERQIQREKTCHFFSLVGLTSVVKRKEDLRSTIPLSIVTSFS